MVEGRNQSVLSDAWAKSAQILEFPEQMASAWEITEAAKSRLCAQLRADCDGFRLLVAMELSRENPEVGLRIGFQRRTPRKPRPSGRRSCRGNSANIRRPEGRNCLDETAFANAISAGIDAPTDVPKRSFIEIPRLCVFFSCPHPQIPAVILPNQLQRDSVHR